MSRTSIADRITKTGQAVQDLSSETLFRIADKDGSGQLDSAEFTRFAEMMKDKLRMEIVQEQVLEKNLVKSKRRLKLVAGVALSLLAIVAVSVAANCVAIYFISDKLKDTSVYNGTLVDKVSRQPLGTSAMYGEVDIVRLPSYQNVNLYNGLGPMFLFTDANGHQSSNRIEGWKWYSETRMDLMLSGGVDILITDGKVFVSQKSGLVTWITDTGTASEFNTKQGAPKFAKEAGEKCDELMCPRSSCVVKTSPFHMVSASCKGEEVWNFKGDPDWATGERRQLIAIIALLPYASAAFAGARAAYQVSSMMESGPWDLLADVGEKYWGWGKG